MERIYKSRHGKISNDDAQVLGDALDRMKDKLRRKIRPQDLVKYSQDPKSTTHHIFKKMFDDVRGSANAHWLAQARRYMDDIVLVVKVQDGPPVSVPVWRRVVLEESQGYEHVEDSMGNPESREYLLGFAMKQIKHWRDTYRMYTELAPIFKAIERVEGRMKKKVKK